MAFNRNREIGIRLNLKDEQTVRRALMRLGDDGQKALARIEKQSAPASRGLMAVNAVSNEARGGMVAFGSRLGAVGSGMMALGPAGLAASAGIGLIVTGLVGAIARAKEAIANLDALDETAKKIGVGVEALQEYRYAFGQTGVNAQTLEMALQRLGRRVGEVANFGKGEAKPALDALGISVFNAAGKVKTLDELLPEVADGLSRVTDQNRRLSLAQKLFDSEGVVMVTLLQDGAAALERFRAEAREVGAVVDAHLVARASEANDRLTTMQRIVDTQLNGALVDLAPLIVDVAKAFADVARWVGDVVDGFREIEDRSTRGLERRLEELNTALARGRQAHIASQVLSGDQAAFMTPDKDYDALVGERAKIQEELRRREETRTRPGGGIADPGQSTATDIQKVTEALRFELEQLGRNEEGRRVYQELQKAGIDGNHAEAQTIRDLVVAIREKEAANAEEEKILRDLEKAAEDALRAEERRAQTQRESLQTLTLENVQTEQLIDAYGRGADAVDRLRTAIELENEATRLGIDFSTSQGQAWAEQYERGQELRERLSDITEAQKEATSEARQFGSTFSSTLSGIAFQAEDAGDAVRNLGLRIAELLANKALFDRLGDALGTGAVNFFNLLGGGGGGAAGLTITTPTTTLHGGGTGPAAGPTRRMPAALFAGAPRLHDGWLRKDEFAAILRDGEGVFTPHQMDNADRLFSAALSTKTQTVVQAPVTVVFQGGTGQSGRIDPAVLDQFTQALERRAEQVFVAAAEKQSRPGGALNRGRTF